MPARLHTSTPATNAPITATPTTDASSCRRNPDSNGLSTDPVGRPSSSTVMVADASSHSRRPVSAIVTTTATSSDGTSTAAGAARSIRNPPSRTSAALIGRNGTTGGTGPVVAVTESWSHGLSRIRW